MIAGARIDHNPICLSYPSQPPAVIRTESTGMYRRPQNAARTTLLLRRLSNLLRWRSGAVGCPVSGVITGSESSSGLILDEIDATPAQPSLDRETGQLTVCRLSANHLRSPVAEVSTLWMIVPQSVGHRSAVIRLSIIGASPPDVMPICGCIRRSPAGAGDGTALKDLKPWARWFRTIKNET